MQSKILSQSLDLLIHEAFGPLPFPLRHPHSPLGKLVASTDAQDPT